MSNEETKFKIADTLKGFSSGNLTANANRLFNALGYTSEKRLLQTTYSPEDFLNSFAKNAAKPLNPAKALVSSWKQVHFLFQLTADEIKAGLQLGLDFGSKKKVDTTIMESYLFFALELADRDYTRTELAVITREINKIFNMPVMILFQHGDTVTLSIIDRRLNKRDENQDVLEKVTLIKDIAFASPHRAHVEILFDLSLNELQRQFGFSNFVELHRAWQKALDSSELNKKFFRELSNWYFWALQNVTFPKDAGDDEGVRNATSVIRLITRLIFIWFIKEKNLVPDELFNPRKLQSILKYNDPKESTYYKAILQNLFFATLNQEMNSPEKPNNRQFRGKSKQPNGRDQHFGITNMYRYENYFQNPAESLRLFLTIPFLNGGLFECLDKPDKDDPTKMLRIDGFSDHKDNEIRMPDYLFFSKERVVDLSEGYGVKNKVEKVRGLIDILERYKFTINENTPIEEEVALDPELLGKVFENLLANYNPETQTTARKSTGSYYTPRDIVNYMVDESLIAYLTTSLKAEIPTLAKTDGVEDILREVFAYKEYKGNDHYFNTAETIALIDAIDNVKVLDPACGSGAFPMGILHKLVFILGKLDPHNELWKERQLVKARENEDPVTREKWIDDIEDSFGRNEMDYGRKLYLIQNCIYGVDIQPIAVQIAKLRFFISLVVDQKVDEKRENRGILPLPNLETKFVAANTLIGLDKPKFGDKLVLVNQRIEQKKKELADVRRRHFAARTQKTKQRCREDDARLRKELGNLLVEDGLPRDTAKKLADWDPYDQNTHAEWFDPEWMFGVTGGLDVVIGNPPYLEARSPSFNDTMKDSLQIAIRSRWSGDADLITRGSDLLIYFFETGLYFLKKHGHLVLITQNSWLNTEYGKKFQTFLLKHTFVSKIVDSGFKHFDSTDGPNINTVISFFVGHTPLKEHSISFERHHQRFADLSQMSFEDAVGNGLIDIAKYKYSNRMLHELKWGMLHDFMNPIFSELIDALNAKGQYLERVTSNAFSLGQGLNLSAEHIVERDSIKSLNLPNKAFIPFFTSEDGAPFNLTETTCFIVNKSNISATNERNLKTKGIKTFDPTTTNKIVPILIMPRGIGRHFCAINSASAYSASCVDVWYRMSITYTKPL